MDDGPEETRVPEGLLREVQEASAEGRLVRLVDAAERCFPDRAPQEAVRHLAELLPDGGGLALIGEGEQTCLYAPSVMTGTYARLAYGLLHSDAPAVVAETVRENSRLYPRPTPVAEFCGPPFDFSPHKVEATIRQLEGDPRYSDIRTTRASDGSLYVYSSQYLVTELAESLAEWDAVGRFNSP